MSKILLVEDSPEFQMITKASLGSAHEVAVVSSGSEALQRVAQQAFDLAILDVDLPDRSGFELYRELCETSVNPDLPVIFLTGKAEITDKVRGYSLGADDYIVKPFDPIELRMRIEARLNSRRRPERAREQVLRVGDLRIDSDVQKAFLKSGAAEQELPLTSTEYKLLNYLIRKQGTIVSRAELLEAIWPEKVNVLDRTVDKHLSSLRKKLEPRSEYIQSIRGEGYCFRASSAS